jgi:hypothetical protein
MKRGTLTIRLSPALRGVIHARSEIAGRSLSEEIEMILEKVIFPIAAEMSES